MKEVSTLKLSKDAASVLIAGQKVFMASSRFGKGFVFAAGDPWLYNEYIDNRKLPAEFNNFTAAKNLISWLLSKTSIIK